MLIIPGIVALCFSPAVFLKLTSVAFGFLLTLVLVFACWVGADASAVSSGSFPAMCVCPLPGCYALAQVDTSHTTVDCLLLASSAATL